VVVKYFPFKKNKGGFKKKIINRGEIDSNHRLVQMCPGLSGDLQSGYAHGSGLYCFMKSIA